MSGKFLFTWFTFCLAASVLSQPTFAHPDRIRYDGHCFTIEGKDTFIYSGAFHYFRCPKELWRQRFKLIKEAGFNTVETYVAWNYSERNKPKNVDDYSQIDLSELDAWLSMAEKEFGLYTIVRPGPYICAEWATGGYPNWLLAFRPEQTKRRLWFRSDDPVFLDWCKHWFKAVAKVVAPHQLTRKPKGQKGVILYQMENEYGEVGVPSEARAAQVRTLMKTSIDGGIDIPLFTCWTDVVRFPKGDPVLSQGFDTPNQYPRWNIEDVGYALRDQHQAQPWAPRMVTELQGGWFGQVGGQAAEEQDGISAAQINAISLYAIQNGLTALNYYMLFGGTNFGDWAAQGITTSYDYFAPIREWGGVGAKYRAVQNVGKFLTRFGPDLARSDEVPAHAAPDSPDVQVAARRGKSGATYLFVRNLRHSQAVAGKLGNRLDYNLPAFGMNVFRYEKSIEDGAWLVEEAAPDRSRPLIRVPLTAVEVVTLRPLDWRRAPTKPNTLGLGIYDSRFVLYRTQPGAKGFLWMQMAAGELISADSLKPERRPGGFAWPLDGMQQTFLLLNPGWANGGADMERPRGIESATVIDKLPDGVEISRWKARVIPSSLASRAPNVEEASRDWDDVTTTSSTQKIFKPDTTVEMRTSFKLASLSNGPLTLNFAGIDDEGWIYLNGKFIAETHEWSAPWSFRIEDKVVLGENSLIVIVKNNGAEGGINGPVTIESPAPLGESLPLEWTDKFEEINPVKRDLRGLQEIPLERIQHGSAGPRPPGEPILTRSRIRFPMPNFKNAACEIILKAGGDGFLTLNGHPLGRYWEVGPQRAFYLPACWLKKENVLEYTATPGLLGSDIEAAELRALPMHE